MARGAPEGYQSEYAAILDLLRFGPGICKPFELLALLFHTERSVNKDSDQHSQNQAVHGVVSKDGRRVIRAPAGMCLAMWKRANAELVKSGFVRRDRHTSQGGKDDPSEYAVIWPAISTAIQKYQAEILLARGSGHTVATPVATQEPLSGHTVATPVATQEPPGKDRIRVATQEPHISPSQNRDLKSVTVRARGAIAAAIAAATGEAVRSDGLVNEILESGERYGLPVEVTVRFIHDFCFDCRAKKYAVNPGLVAKAVRDGDMGTWANKLENQNFIQRVMRQVEQEAEIAEIQKLAEKQKAGAQ